jgi:molecular chaperone GrpE (heat shock protein)
VLEADALAEIATAVWRLGRKIESTAETPAGVRRHLQTLVDALAEGGVRTRSYEGTAFDPGLRMRVLAYQPMPHLRHDEVVETVRPGVYLHGVPIALGEVIVGIPPEDDEPADASGERGAAR